MSRFVKPITVRIPISQGDFIDVKKRLNHGEHEDYMAKIMPFMTPGDVVQKIERRNVRTAKVLSYLVGWSLTDDGAIVPYSVDLSEQQRVDTLNNLDTDTFTEIYVAISEHEEAVDQEVAAAKNGKDGVSVSSPISPSPSSSGGDTNGSETLTEMSTT